MPLTHYGRGLYIVRELMERLRGSIHVDSNPVRSTCMIPLQIILIRGEILCRYGTAHYQSLAVPGRVQTNRITACNSGGLSGHVRTLELR